MENNKYLTKLAAYGNYNNYKKEPTTAKKTTNALVIGSAGAAVGAALAPRHPVSLLELVRSEPMKNKVNMAQDLVNPFYTKETAKTVITPEWKSKVKDFKSEGLGYRDLRKTNSQPRNVHDPISYLRSITSKKNIRINRRNILGRAAIGAALGGTLGWFAAEGDKKPRPR